MIYHIYHQRQPCSLQSRLMSKSFELRQSPKSRSLIRQLDFALAHFVEKFPLQFHIHFILLGMKYH